jgi:hypothetical protein
MRRCTAASGVSVRRRSTEAPPYRAAKRPSMARGAFMAGRRSAAKRDIMVPPRPTARRRSTVKPVFIAPLPMAAPLPITARRFMPAVRVAAERRIWRWAARMVAERLAAAERPISRWEVRVAAAGLTAAGPTMVAGQTGTMAERSAAAGRAATAHSSEGFRTPSASAPGIAPPTPKPVILGALDAATGGSRYTG